MLQTRAECTPDEASRELAVELPDVRSAFARLSQLGKVTKRLEEGKAVYKLPEAANMRIPGSAASPLEMRKGTADQSVRARGVDLAASLEAKAPKAATATLPAEKPERKPRKGAPPGKPSAERAAVLETVKKHPASTANQIAEMTGLDAKTVHNMLQRLTTAGEVTRTQNKRPHGWLTVEEAAKGLQTSAAIVKPKAGRKPGRKLHDLGAASPAPAVLDGLENPALAIDAAGVVAIETVKLSPRGIANLVGFLEKTQHVWKGALA